MLASRESRLLETRLSRLRERTRAKQQRLEQMLAAPAASPGEIVRRKRWITEALDLIKRAQTDATYRASVLDAYTEHLSVLEMTLLGAAEDTSAAPPGNTAKSSTR